MAEELKELIEKIQEEGIKAAMDKAGAIEEEARKKAEHIIRNAEKKAEQLLEEAKESAAKMEASGISSIRQASRDAILSLKKEINEMLERLIASHVHRALPAEELARIIRMLVKEYKGKDDVIISLDKEDLKKLEQGFLSELRQEAKKGVTLKSSDDILGGFTISYDSGKSHYDFTDKAIAQYIGAYLKPKLLGILKENGNRVS